MGLILEIHLFEKNVRPSGFCTCSRFYRFFFYTYIFFVFLICYISFIAQEVSGSMSVIRFRFSDYLLFPLIMLCIPRTCHDYHHYHEVLLDFHEMHYFISVKSFVFETLFHSSEIKRLYFH